MQGTLESWNEDAQNTRKNHIWKHEAHDALLESRLRESITKCCDIREPKSTQIFTFIRYFIYVYEKVLYFEVFNKRAGNDNVYIVRKNV